MKRLLPILTCLSLVSAGDLLPRSIPACNLSQTCTGPPAGYKAFFAAYRKDFYLNGYDEDEPVPMAGGRVQVIADWQISGAAVAPFTAYLDGQLANMSAEAGFDTADWLRVDVDAPSQTMMVSFHSRNTAMFDNASVSALPLVVTDSTGAFVFQGSFPVKPNVDLRLTYLTTAGNGSQIIVHLHNFGSSPHTLSGLMVDGRDATAAACLSRGDVIPAGGHRVFIIPACTAKRSGDLLTAVVLATDTDPAVGGVRVIRETYPVWGWGHSGECAFPSWNDTRWATLKSGGLDSLFVTESYGAKCGQDPFHLASVVAPATTDFSLMIGTGMAMQPDKLPDRSRVIGAMVADEDDGSIGSGMRSKLATILQVSAAVPDVPTFQGGKTNRNSGAFAGLADVQGVDAYAAGCAPHFTKFTDSVRLHMPYDYGRNTRNNAMPMPTWIYSQYFGKWGQTPSSQALQAQIAFTAAAGAKGTLLFQPGIDVIAQQPQAFKDTAAVLWNIRAVAEVLRIGDVDSVPCVAADAGSGHSVVSCIGSPQGIVVVAVNTKADSYSSITCHIGIGAKWKFHPHTIGTISVTVPPEWGVGNVVELVNGSPTNLQRGASTAVSTSNRTVSITNVSVDDTSVARFFLLTPP